MATDIKTTAQSVEITPSGFREVDVTLSGVDESSVLDHFSANDVINHFGTEAILNEIGQKECVDHFGLTLADDD